MRLSTDGSVFERNEEAVTLGCSAAERSSSKEKARGAFRCDELGGPRKQSDQHTPSPSGAACAIQDQPLRHETEAEQSGMRHCQFAKISLQLRCKTGTKVVASTLPAIRSCICVTATGSTVSVGLSGQSQQLRSTNSISSTFTDDLLVLVESGTSRSKT